MTLNRLTAEKKAIGLLCAAVLMLGVSALVQINAPQALAQESPDDRDAPPHPGGGPERNAGPGGHRDEMRKMFREEMRERYRNDGGERGEGGPRGGGPGGPGEPGAGGGQGRIGRFLDVVQSYQTAVQDSHQAVGLAALGIKDHYRRNGKPLDAVKELEEMLAQTTDQKMRNIFLFIIKQIYEEQRDSAKFLEVSRRIVKENIGSKSK